MQQEDQLKELFYFLLERKKQTEVGDKVHIKCHSKIVAVAKTHWGELSKKRDGSLNNELAVAARNKEATMSVG